MKANHLAITSLEEYEPNREFVGRNFNAGEVVQLVLRAPYSGHWLGFRSVQMVMIHELAHCAQMNHSAAFWKVRNGFAEELRGLWGNGYTGDGFWGRGETLLSGQYDWRGVLGEEELLPRSLCGGTFRSGRRRKRKRGGDEKKSSSLTYAERQRRRIARKFGTDGVKLGDDVETRVKLEDGKRPKGKPRVAGSARGRELRASAALARFGNQKAEKMEHVKKHEDDGDVGSESGSDDDDSGAEDERAVDLGGARLLDGRGHGMVKVCDGEDPDDGHVKQEMQELQYIDDIAPHALSRGKEKEEEEKDNLHPFNKTEEPGPSQRQNPPPGNTITTTADGPLSKLFTPQRSAREVSQKARSSPLVPSPPDHERSLACPLCSQTNGPAALICATCSHVLDLDRIPGHWRCSSSLCAREGSAYVNGGDCGVCGACG
ncbi:hypothetical protein MMC22_002093 [Lobaria immixta]|nr:hypothetical protein [Lobaria immixta]